MIDHNCTKRRAESKTSNPERLPFLGNFTTTLIGCGMLLLNLLTLPMIVDWHAWEKLNSVAVAITVCGGFVFGAGLILAFFRDRLLILPERIQRREGVFRVFNRREPRHQLHWNFPPEWVFSLFC
ncbi:MAG: hypothetical protein WCK86_16655 [Planctomycetia bacterium]